jgi:hypothetical protein
MPPSSPSRARWQTSAAVTGAALLAWRHPGAATFGLTAVALALAALAWIAPDRYRPVQRRLDRALDMLLAALTWILLGLVYLGVFTPLRLIRRLLGRDPLGGRRAPAGESYLTPLPPGATGRFDRQF